MGIVGKGAKFFDPEPVKMAQDLAARIGKERAVRVVEGLLREYEERLARDPLALADRGKLVRAEKMLEELRGDS